MERSSLSKFSDCFTCNSLLHQGNVHSGDAGGGGGGDKAKQEKREPQGWKCMPYIIGICFFDRFSTKKMLNSIAWRRPLEDVCFLRRK